MTKPSMSEAPSKSHNSVKRARMVQVKKRQFSELISAREQEARMEMRRLREAARSPVHDSQEWEVLPPGWRLQEPNERRGPGGQPTVSIGPIALIVSTAFLGGAALAWAILRTFGG